MDAAQRKTLEEALRDYRQCLVCLKIIKRGVKCCRREDLQEKLTLQMALSYVLRALPAELRTLLYPSSAPAPCAEGEETSESVISTDAATTQSQEQAGQLAASPENSGEEPSDSLTGPSCISPRTPETQLEKSSPSPPVPEGLPPEESDDTVYSPLSPPLPKGSAEIEKGTGSLPRRPTSPSTGPPMNMAPLPRPPSISTPPQSSIRITKTKAVTSSVLSAEAPEPSGRIISYLNDRHKCIFCAEKFQYPCQFEKHLLRHVHEKPYQCPHCNKEFSIRASCLAHTKFNCHARSKERPFRCSVCQRTFRTKSTLTRHGHVHSTKRPIHPCTLCQATFKTKPGLYNHVTTKHQGMKFTCDLCGQSYARAAALRQHLRRHQNIRMQSCIFCHKAFVTTPELFAHLKMHTRERACRVCGRTFRNRGALREHFLACHPSETKQVGPRSCIFCGKGFARQCRFESHIWRHTAERWYSCKICGTRFLHRHDMKHHVRSFHK